MENNHIIIILKIQRQLLHFFRDFISVSGFVLFCLPSLSTLPACLQNKLLQEARFRLIVSARHLSSWAQRRSGSSGPRGSATMPNSQWAARPALIGHSFSYNAMLVRVLMEWIYDKVCFSMHFRSLFGNILSLTSQIIIPLIFSLFLLSLKAYSSYNVKCKSSIELTHGNV